jgi:HAMP domain-containing protein
MSNTQRKDSLSHQDTRILLHVLIAIKNGDLSIRLPSEWVGLNGEIAGTVNQTIDQLGAFSAEVTRVAREVGTEGKLGGQAKVEGVSGTWKDLTDNVNSMADNLTTQVRNIADVTTAVAKGDLSKKITAEVKGEVLELKNTINTMVDQLGAFASSRDIAAQEQLANREKELQRMAELERFQKLTVGRELKMIELKQEISMLRSDSAPKTE